MALSFASRPSLRVSFASALTIAALTLSAETAFANDIEYCTFSSVAGLQLNGNATQVATTLRLTRNVANQDSSAFYTTPLALTATTDFHTHFQFVLTPGATQADGVTFVVQADPRGDTALGGNGGGIAYGNSNGGTPIAKSVEIEFDAYQNTWDPNDNHVGVMTNGDETTHVAVATPAFTLASSVPIDAWVDYDSATTTLSVYVSNTGGTKPATPLVTTGAVNVFSTVGAAAYFGVTGSTGGDSEQQVFNMWILNRGAGLSECTCTTNAECAAPTPVCEAPPGVCVQCLTNTDCGGTTPVCDTLTHTCGPCTGNADCGGATPYCAPVGDPLAGACVACVTDAECDGSPNTTTPICSKAAGASTDTCVACATNAQCTAAGLEPVCVTSGAHDGQCAQCATNPDCSGATPVCVDTGATDQCEQCSTDANCSGKTPICSTTTYTCGPCTSDSQCTTPTPACQTGGTLQGECTQCSATNSTQCTGADPVCDTTTGSCVACNTDADCGMSTPVCVGNVCVGCTSDYTATNPPAGSCPTAALPACQTSGALAGQCTQCSATDDSVCTGLPAQPVCVAAKGDCGCTQNSDCGAQMICDTASPPAGQCVASGSDAGADASDGSASGSSSGSSGNDSGSGSDSGEVTDSGEDGGEGNDSGSSSGSSGGSSGSGSGSSSGSDSGLMADATVGSDSGAPNQDQPTSLEGGGCAAGGDPASSIATWGALGALFMGAAFGRRRQRRSS